MPVAVGFLSGGALLQCTDALLHHLQGSLEELDMYKSLAVSDGSAVSRQQRLRRLLMLIIAITIHNFPEGMAVGVGFGAIGTSPAATLGGAVSLALGIGIQNFPEGLAVSMPLMREGVSPLKAFWYGQLSGVVEPIGGVLGAAFVQYCKPLLPFTMSLAAGAMIYVVVDQLVPEALEGRRKDSVGASANLPQPGAKSFTSNTTDPQADDIRPLSPDRTKDPLAESSRSSRDIHATSLGWLSTGQHRHQPAPALAQHGARPALALAGAGSGTPGAGAGILALALAGAGAGDLGAGGRCL